MCAWPPSIGLVLWLVLVHVFHFSFSTHLRGTYDPDTEFFKFIVKFGFQKTERHDHDSFGYIFGNVTSAGDEKLSFPVTLAVLDKSTFLEYYGNRSIVDRDLACRRMFNTLKRISFDSKCSPQAKGDYLRRVPCRKGHLCDDETAPANVMPKHQLTYVINNLVKPRFWYISLVACYRDTSTCQWHYYDWRKFKAKGDQPALLNYDLTLVNGNPNHSSYGSYHPLSHQFSFDQQNTLEMYLIFFVVYLILVPMQLYAVQIQKHPVTKLFTISLVFEFISLCFILTHMIRFAINGEGNNRLKTIGDIFDVFSRTSFILILLLLAKGWAVTRQQISRTGWIILMATWIPYCVFNVFLYIWNRTEIDIISDVDEYQTWPGWLVLTCRTLTMLWFLFELRNTMKYEHSTKKLDFLLHFGASSLVWFIYLPMVALVAMQVSPMWRYKLLLGITNSADCLAYCVMTGLLWPNRSGQYLLLAAPNYAGMDELDEFNEAPHIVNSDLLLSTGAAIGVSSGATIEHTILENGDSEEFIRNGDVVNIDLLDEDDIVLSTDDLLLNNSTGGHATTERINNRMLT